MPFDDKICSRPGEDQPNGSSGSKKGKSKKKKKGDRREDWEVPERASEFVPEAPEKPKTEDPEPSPSFDWATQDTGAAGAHEEKVVGSDRRGSQQPVGGTNIDSRHHCRCRKKERKIGKRYWEKKKH